MQKKAVGPAIDVIVPAYNEERSIGQCLDSLTHQTFEGAYRIIVIDNNSTDHTREIVKSFPQVILKKENKKGYVYAVKSGVEKYSIAPIVAQTDADTIVDRKWLEEISSAFKDDPSLIACGGPFYFHDGNPIFRTIVNGMNYVNPKAFSFYLCGVNMAYKKKSYVQIGGYDSSVNLGADTLLGMKLNKIGNVKFFSSQFVWTTSRRFSRPRYVLKEVTRQSTNFLSIKLRNKPLFFANTDYRN